MPPLDANFDLLTSDIHEEQPGADVTSQARDTNGSGIANRTKRRNTALQQNIQADNSDDTPDDDDDDGDAATGSSGRPIHKSKRTKRETTKKPNQQMTGRFSGRLPTKEDERKLADECQLMGHFLSEDGSLSTLPTIIRAVASGNVRAYLEKQKAEKESLQQQVAYIQSHPNGHDVVQLTEQLVVLHQELNTAQIHIANLEKQLLDRIPGAEDAPPLKVVVSQAAGQQQTTLQRLNSIPGTGSAGLPIDVAHQTMHAVAQATGQPQHQAVTMLGTAPSGSVVQVQPQAQIVQMAPQTDATVPLVTQQVIPNGTATTALAKPLVVTTVQPSAAQGVLRTVPSSAQLVTATTQPLPPVAVVGGSEAGVATAPADADPAAAAAGVAATSLNEHAQQLAVTAHLHGAAKTNATVQAQQLAQHAQQHAHASVQAAQQAEELKKTLAVLPDSHETQQAVATVHNLEARAQAHASITTQVVAQARDLHEKAQAHEKEQIKAMKQAHVLQAHAQSLQASAQQLEAQAVQGDSGGAQPATAAAAAAGGIQMAATGTASGPGTNNVVGGNGVPLTGTDAGQQLVISAQNPPASAAGGLPTTPHSTASGGANLFGSAAAQQADAAVPVVTQVLPNSTAAQAQLPQTAVTMLPTSAPLPVGQPVQLVVQQPHASILTHPSGDQSAEAMQHQLVVMQQAQHAIAATTAVSHVPPTHPPVTLQIIPAAGATAPAAAPSAATMTKVASHNMLTLLPTAGGTAIAVAAPGIAPLPPIMTAAPAVHLDASSMPTAANITSQQQIQQVQQQEQAMDIPSVASMEGALPSLQQLMADPLTGQDAAHGGPVVSIPETLLPSSGGGGAT